MKTLWLRRGWAVLCLAVGLAGSTARADFALYSNGTVPITDEAWAISGPLRVSNSFTLSGSSTVAVIDGIGLICLEGSTPEDFTWSLGTTEFGGEITGPNTVGVIATKIGTTTGGDDVFSATIDTGNINLGPGTYWFTLGGGTTSLGDGHELYWTVTHGSSLAFQQNGSDTPQSIGSEAFTIVGVPEPATWALMAAGAGMIALVARRRHTQIKGSLS